MRPVASDSFGDLAGALEDLLAGGFRRELTEAAVRRGRLVDALAYVRPMMRGHLWSRAGRSRPLTAAVADLDARTRADGFHALNDWDGIADHVNAEVVPVDVLDFVGRAAGHLPAAPGTVAVLVDYYFFHLLALLSLRIWDLASPDDALRQVGRLLDRLQGEDGSGQPFVRYAETLLLIATSHYEPDEHGYPQLLDRTTALSREAQVTIATEHAASLGAHLRFGFFATYARNTTEMRDDNVADYPWLRWSVNTLLHAPPSAARTEALLGGLTADTDVLIDDAAIGDGLRARGPEGLAAFAALRPTRETYSPLSFCFNFSHNVLKGVVIDAALRGDPWTVSYSDLLCGAAAGDSALRSRESLARTLMDYARRSPQRIRGERLPVLVYDPDAGQAAFDATLTRLHRSVT